MQNQPAREKVYPIRKAFIAKPGYSLVVADYSQLELRVLGHFIKQVWSKPSTLCESFETGQDTHKLMASILYNIPYDKVTPEQRTIAKSTTFGVCYGMQGRKLSRQIGIPEQDAIDLLSHYFKLFPEIKLIQQLLIKKAKQDGVVYTLRGHARRFTDELDKPDTEGLNALIQGSAADIVKQAQLSMMAELPAGAHQIIQVHDEIIVETPTELSDLTVSAIKHSMEETTALNVRLLTEPKIVNNWMEAK